MSDPTRIRLSLLLVLMVLVPTSAAGAVDSDVNDEPEPSPAVSASGEPAPISDASVIDPAFSVRPFELRDLAADELSWTGEPPPPLPHDRLTDEAGVPLFRWTDGRLYYRPGALAINGLKRIDAYRETGDRRHLEQALRHADKFRELAIHERGAAWLPFWFDYRPAKLKAPWFNAMAQGLALSFFVRLHAVTLDPADLATATELFASFTLPGPSREAWVTLIDDGHLWLEHYPNRRRDHHLNAHLHALLGLYEYWQATRSPEARRTLLGAVTTVRDLAGRFRRPGRTSFYSSRTRTVIPSYHDIHVWQLRLLGEITGDPYFTRLGDDLAEDRAPKAYVPGRPERDGLRVERGGPPMRLRLGTFPPTGAWSASLA